MKYLAIILFLISSAVHAGDWYLGAWKVMGAKLPGVSAMDLDEAKTWFDSEAEYTQEKVTFRNEVCDNPIFKTETLSKDEFYSSYRVSFEQLGIEGQAVEILNVGCPAEWVAAGSTVIKANAQFSYTLWDGVFFKIVKVAP